jgi:hypothetical protein
MRKAMDGKGVDGEMRKAVAGGGNERWEKQWGKGGDGRGGRQKRG